MLFLSREGLPSFLPPSRDTEKGIVRDRRFRPDDVPRLRDVPAAESAALAPAVAIVVLSQGREVAAAGITAAERPQQIRVEPLNRDSLLLQVICKSNASALIITTRGLSLEVRSDMWVLSIVMSLSVQIAFICFRGSHCPMTTWKLEKVKTAITSHAFDG